MTTIATFGTPQDAHLMRMRLESAGIASYVQGENVFQTLGAPIAAPILLQVADEDALPARQFLAADQGLP